jgi:DMSO/TMAO reductase YedYZ heme-binding membrane subunit
MKLPPLTIICFAIFLAGVCTFLAQMWVHPFGAAMFLKIIVTEGVLFLIFFVLAFLIKENKEAKRMNGDLPD